jgi:hypothetical protein
MPITDERLFEILSERGVDFQIPINAPERVVRVFKNLEDQRGGDGRIHPVYARREDGRLITRPNIFNLKPEYIRPAPGLILLPASVAKFEAVNMCAVKGEYDLARELAETEMNTGEFFLRQFNMPVTAEAERHTKMVFFQGMYGKAKPDIVEPNTEPFRDAPRWDAFMRKWKGFRVAMNADVRKEHTRKVWSNMYDVVTTVSRAFEEDFPGLLTGIWMDTLIIETNFMRQAEIETFLTDAFRAAGGYNYRLWVDGYSNVPVNHTSKIGLLFDTD